ncbi:LPD38 domain-containing protein [Stutzerimonas sp. NM35]
MLNGVAPGEVRGVFRTDAQYLVADNHSSLEDAVRTAAHEMIGHRGIRGLLGDEITATMERIYSSEMTRATGRKRIEQIREHYAKVLKGKSPEQQRTMIAEEIIAHLAEDGDRPALLQRVASKIRELLRKLFPQVAWTYTDMLALIGQSREWLRRNNSDAGSESHTDQLYSLRSSRQHTSEAFSDLTAKQKEALSKIAPLTPQQRAIDWFRQHSDRALLKIRQGLVDRFAALRELDEAAHGKDILNTDITSSSWVLARMSSAASGALHAMLNNGRIYLDQQQKVIDIQPGDAMGLGSTLARLGTAAEIERFFGWIAGNRSAKLAAEGRENLFDAAEIDALRTLNRGTTEGGKDRGALYSEVFTEFQQYRDDVLAIAEQTGVITPESRALWRDEFYVPFYRVIDEDGPSGPMASKGLTRQEAYKKLKGGKQNLNDLLQNTLLNFNHLLTASLKNQAAAQAISNAEHLGIAQPVSESARDKKASTFVLKAGVKQWYNIDDPLVFEALSSLSDAGLNNAAVRAMSFFKRLFTNMTTITPQFIIANLLRDSMSATATSPVSKNFLKNIAVGGKDWTDARKRARMLASGGAFSFGHIYSNDPDEVKAHLTRNLRSAQLIDGPKLVPQAIKAGWDAWNAFANTAENTNRAAIYGQNEQSKGKLTAAFEARDLMDFSMHGAWPAVRFLIRVVPFLNARLQGLDKLYRAGVKPSLLTAFGQGDASDKQAAKRFLTVTTALSLASMALMLVNNDDEEYRKLEEWQKDTYWFVRLGGKAFFIPKPFEVGAIATMTERLLQQAIDDKATGKLFAQRLGHTLTQTFSFSPVPHMFQPVLDVYSNVDAFTGRPIESTGMDRLSKGLRTRASTTAPAKAVSAASRAFGDEFPLAVSPIQADHLIAGYLGQVGAWSAGMADTIWRSANGETQPARHWHEYQPVRRFYRDLDTPAAYTRYSTLFYEGLREAGQAYADVKELQELGRMEEARKVIADKRDVLGMRKQLNQAQRRLSAINSRMDAVRLSSLDADSKRRELDRMLVIKGRLTEMAGKRIEDMRARR